MSSSCLSTERDTPVTLPLLFEFPVTNFQIFLSPFFFLVVEGTEDTGGSGDETARGHDWDALNVGVLLPMSMADG